MEPTIYVDLDETKTIEVKTGGLTDEQIKARAMDAFESDIDQAERCIDGLQVHIDASRERIRNTRLIIGRKRQLGD